MTIKEFVAKVARSRVKWILVPGDGRIRVLRNGIYECPIIYLSSGARHLGLSKASARAIIAAADDFPTADANLRKSLLTACKLTEMGKT